VVEARAIDTRYVDVAEAAALLRAGGLVAFGTETVYGLGADATNAQAVARIFAAKGRPHFNPLICHFADADAAFAHVVADPRAVRLAAALWPGPLTLVLPRRTGSAIDPLAAAGSDTLAVRVPAHAGARDLLRSVGRPVAAPSANRSGSVSPTTAAHVLADLGGRIDAVVDSGEAAVGLESTVVDLSGGGAVVLRPGGVPVEVIEDLIGHVGRGIAPASVEPARGLRSPGLMVSHYAPVLPVRLNAVAVAADEALLAFGSALPGAGLVYNLSERADLMEAASRLFAGLRWLDAEARRLGLVSIAASPIPCFGLGEAITDRLQRAAAPR